MLNLVLAALQYLFGLTGFWSSCPADAVSNRLQFRFFRPRVADFEPDCDGQLHDAFDRVARQSGRSRYRPNLLAGQPPADHLFHVHGPYLPVRHAVPPSGCMAYVRENHNGGWVNDPENAGSKFLKTGGSKFL